MLEKQGIIRPSSSGPYNKCDEKEQWIRLSDGCPNNCPFCYETSIETVYPIPEIVRNQVKIMDMNLLSKPHSLSIIRELGPRRIGRKVVYYELVCGIDYRFLTDRIAYALKSARFKNIRIGWDLGYAVQMKIKDAIDNLIRAGYKTRKMTIFMICNWEISYEECLKKLYLCAIWRIKVADCYFDGQTSPNIKPIGWSAEQIKDFRRKVRKHNQLVLFGIDPEIKK